MLTTNPNLWAGAKSVGIEPTSHTEARQAYEAGMSLKRLRSHFHLSAGELRDVAPEEFTGIQEPDGDVGGY